MPRSDWYDDDVKSRNRSDRDGRFESDDRDNNRGGLFSSDRDSRRDRTENREFTSRERGYGHTRQRSTGRDEDQRFGADDFNRGVPMDETRKLIASNKVEGTPVYDRHGDKLGTIHNFMVDKRKGHVVYAVLKHGGGFLGMGERYYPLEWDQLTYDTRLDGYHVDITEEDLESFGSFDSEGRWERRRPQASNRSQDRRDRW